MKISGCPFAVGRRPAVSRGPLPASADRVERSEADQSADLRRLREAALARVPSPTGAWGSAADLDAALAGALRNQEEPVEADDGGRVAEQICTFQARKADKEGGAATRLVHRQQLHGGAATVHWNPLLRERLQLFEQGSTPGVVRLSDADAAANPDGKSMYGFALELVGSGGAPTDILLTGGTARTEASQARDADAQLALFNMLNPTSVLGGLLRILHDVGPWSGPRMLLDVARMKTELSSLTELTAWSRAPFAVRDRAGDELLVKMRVRPLSAPSAEPVEGQTSSQRLSADLASRLAQGDARWMLDFQFARPGDDLHDPRERWGGPWLPAGEVVLPRSGDAGTARELAAAVDDVKFSPWKGKLTGADREVLRPWGALNRARLAAYAASGAGRA